MPIQKWNSRKSTKRILRTCALCGCPFDLLKQSYEIEIWFEYQDAGTHITLDWARLTFDRVDGRPPDTCDECRQRIIEKFAEEMKLCLK